MRKLHLNWKAGLLSLLLAAGVACPAQAATVKKSIMCVKTNTGKYFPVVRVSMMVVADGGSTFEIVLKDGEGEANVSDITFEKHEEEIDFSKYSSSSSSSDYIDTSKKIYLITNTGKYYTFKKEAMPTMDVQPGTSLFTVTAGSEVEKDVRKVYFYRGDDIDQAVADGIVAPNATIAEKLTLMTPISSQMTISGCGDAAEAVVYSVKGTKVAEAEVNNGATTLQVGHLTKGVYVVKVGNKSLKFMKK